MHVTICSQLIGHWPLGQLHAGSRLVVLQVWRAGIQNPLEYLDCMLAWQEESQGWSAATEAVTYRQVNAARLPAVVMYARQLSLPTVAYWICMFL